MANFTNTTGANTVNPSDVSLNSIELSSNIQLYWPNDIVTGNTTADIIDVVPLFLSSFSLYLPDVRRGSVGAKFQINNRSSATSFSVKTFNGATPVISINAMQSYDVYLYDKSSPQDPRGEWHAVLLGIGTVPADMAPALAGYGLEAFPTTESSTNADRLHTKITPTVVLNTLPSPLDATYRAKFISFQGANGSLILPPASTSNVDGDIDSGFWFMLQNLSSDKSVISINPAPGKLDNKPDTFHLQYQAAAIFCCDGGTTPADNNWFTLNTDSQEILFPPNSAASPSITFTTDQTTGGYLSSDSGGVYKSFGITANSNAVADFKYYLTGIDAGLKALDLSSNTVYQVQSINYTSYLYTLLP